MGGDGLETPAAPAGQAAAAGDTGGAPTGDGEIPPWISKVVWRSIWQVILAVVLAWVGLWILHQTRDLVRYLIFSLLLSFAIEPAVIYLHEKHGWRRGAATGLILFLAFLLIVLISVLLGGALIKGANGIVRSLPRWVDQFDRWTQRHFHRSLISGSSSVASQNAVKHLQTYLTEHGADILGSVTGALGVVFSVFTVGMFTFYLTANGHQVRRAVCSRMPPARQREVLWAWEESIKKMGGYLYSRGLLAAINGFLMFVTLLIVGTPYAAPLALFEGVVAEFIPIVGTYVAGAVPVLVTLLTQGVGPALIVLGEILVYQQIENYFLSPKISAKTMELNAGVAFGAALAGGAIGGFIGAFFGLPIAAVIQSFVSTYGKHYEVVEDRLTHVDAPPSAKPKKERRLMRRHSRDPDESAPPPG
jgi:predicted PurR-regulated permease PerM